MQIPPQEVNYRNQCTVSILRPIVSYFGRREFEWTFAAICLSLGLAMFIWPQMAHGSIVRILVEFVGGPAAAAVFLLVGFSSIIALIINGYSKIVGPWVRSVGALWRSMLWAEFTYSMLLVSIEQGFPSPMLFVFPWIVFTELIIVYRAVLDVGQH